MRKPWRSRKIAIDKNDDRNITGDEIIWRSGVEKRTKAEDEKWNGEGARKMAGG